MTMTSYRQHEIFDNATRTAVAPVALRIYERNFTIEIFNLRAEAEKRLLLSSTRMRIAKIVRYEDRAFAQEFSNLAERLEELAAAAQRRRPENGSGCSSDDIATLRHLANRARNEVAKYLPPA